MSDELSQLKEQADRLGITYKANIGVESLRGKIAVVLAGDGQPESDEEAALIDPTNAARASAGAQKSAPAKESPQEFRERVIADATRLVRLRITCLDPAKQHSKGEVISVGNKYTGAISKFVAFGEATDEGYHVPHMIYEELKARKFNSIRSEKGTNGTFRPVQRLVNAFALEVLDPLTPDELERLARVQAAAAGN